MRGRDVHPEALDRTPAAAMGIVGVKLLASRSGVISAEHVGQQAKSLGMGVVQEYDLDHQVAFMSLNRTMSETRRATPVFWKMLWR